MPIFDFRCKSCNNTYQSIISFQKKEAATCPKCQSKEKIQIYKANTTGPVTNSCRSSSGFS